jgi:hypothetical protein
MRIGIVGTFDVANFGDLLFPLLAANELGERLGPHELVPYSYHDLGPDGWAYEVRSLGRLFHDLPELDLLLVGGGDLVRFDKGVAPGYGPADPTVHHPTGYWLSPTLLAASCGVPVAWNAVGVVPGAPEWAQEILRLAVGSVDYLTVRDEQSARELTRAAPSTHIRIVPDTAFGVRRLVPESPTEAFRRLRERAGLGKGYVVLQASHELLPYSAQIEQALAVARRAGLAIVELPASPALGDRAGLFRADAAVVRLDEWPHPLLFAEIIGGAEAVIAKSLHVSIVALAFGVPVHRPRGASDPKHAPLEALQGMSFWEAGDDGGARLQAALGQGEPGPDARQRAVELSAHWDAVAALAGTRRAPRAGVVAQLTTGATSVLDAAMAQAERRPTLSEQELELLQTERMSGAAEARSHLELERLRRECTELRAAQTALRGELAQRQALLDLMLCSASWRVTAPLRRIRVGLAAARAAARRAAGRLARRGASAVGEPASSLFDSTTLRYTPLVSVLMPVHDTEPILLRATVESVRRQTYPHWELCICDDGSTRTGTVATLRELAADDDRIRLSVSEENRGVSAASNRALALASGELAALLDHDDELAPDALLECIRVFGDHPETQVVYTDEDKLDEHGRHCESFFKPDWSPELFRGVMYVGHLLVARRELVEDIGGFDPEFDSIQDYELMLRLSERTDRIRHIPKVLYHWRKLEGSLAASLDAKPGITELQARAVNAHLERCGLPGEASPHPVLGHRVVIRPRDRREWPSVSIVIPSKDAADLLGPCLESVRRISTYPATSPATG